MTNYLYSVGHKQNIRVKAKGNTDQKYKFSFVFCLSFICVKNSIIYLFLKCENVLWL